MQTIQEIEKPTAGFDPIPTRITDLPPLIVDRNEVAVREQVVDSLRDLSTNLAEIHRTAAEAYLSQGMHQEALPHLETAATFAPTEIEYRNQLGFVRYLLGDDDGAVESFNTVLSADPRQPDALFNLGMVLFGRQQLADAESCFRRAVEMQPNDQQSWNNLGVCIHRQGRAEDAKSCFDRALQIDPDDNDARFNLENL